MLLLDKGYYDYDFEVVEKPKVVTDWEKTIKSDEEVQNILNIFGMGKKKEMTLEETQEHILKQMEDK